MLEDVCAAILAGGLGTRLRSCVADRPKVLADVAGRPFLSYLLDQLETAGIKEVVLCTGYLSELIEKEYGASYASMAVRYSVEKEALGTAGALRNSLELLSTQRVLVLNGDSYCGTDLGVYMSWHEAQRVSASLILKVVDDTERYGSVIIGDNGQVQHFAEKKGVGEGLVNAGIYLIETSLLNEIPTSLPFSLENHIFPGWAARGILYGFRADIKHFVDIGTPESYEKAQKLFSCQ